MNQTTDQPFVFPSLAASTPTDLLTEVISQEVRTRLAQAVEIEVQQWIDAHAHVTDELGYRQVVCNGCAPPRSVASVVSSIRAIRFNPGTSKSTIAYPLESRE